LSKGGNWTSGALHFNGRDQYAVLSNDDIERPVTMIVGRGSAGERRTIAGEALANPQISLSNSADVYVAGTPQGRQLSGVIDFLRLARGTLADSKTTIEELYAWQFHGPFLQDFTGRPRPADGGYAGAIDGGNEKRDE
jgi:hypothetical protein